jgi:hypothetical protein
MLLHFYILPLLFLVLSLFKLVYLLLGRYQSYFLSARTRIHILARRPAVLSGVVVVFLRLSGKSLNSTESYTKTSSFNVR